MTSALRALMSGTIDYAGLFPPARLPLSEAFAEYLSIRQSTEAWMLGRFVMPAADVGHLEAWAAEINSSRQSLRLSLVGRPSDSLDECHGNLKEDFSGLNEFSEAHLRQPCDVSLELPLPASVSHADDLETSFEEFYDRVMDVVEESASPLRSVFIEVPPVENAAELRESLITLIPGFPDFGFKFRTGGLSPQAFPPVDEFARIIADSMVNECRWKATAGLHHPIRHTNAGLGVKMHGFLNVLFGAVLADTHDLDQSAVAEILADEDAGNLIVTDDGIRWRDFSASLESIESARLTTFQSFGSCSFDEPRDDLKSLGLL